MGCDVEGEACGVREAVELAPPPLHHVADVEAQHERDRNVLLESVAVVERLLELSKLQKWNR